LFSSFNSLFWFANINNKFLIWSIDILLIVDSFTVIVLSVCEKSGVICVVEFGTLVTVVNVTIGSGWTVTGSWTASLDVS
jgi:hypothetical protein